MLIRQVGQAAPACRDELGRSRRSQRAGLHRGPAPWREPRQCTCVRGRRGGVIRGDAEKFREGVGPRTLLRNGGGARCALEEWMKSVSGRSCWTGRQHTYVNERAGQAEKLVYLHMHEGRSLACPTLRAGAAPSPFPPYPKIAPSGPLDRRPNTPTKLRNPGWEMQT